MFKPRYQITSDILNKLNEISVLKEKISQCNIHPKEEINLKRSAILRMVHNSTAIEGNMLNLFEVKKVLEGKTVNANLREIYEVKNYKKALDFISKKQNFHITEKNILEIHSLLTINILSKEKSGHYRNEPVYVVRRTPISNQVLYTAPNFKKVQALIKELCIWINKAKKEKLSPILIAGIAHSEIAAIHPFADGNGRTARLLATLILYASKYDFRKLFALENYYNSNRPSYYKAIHLGKNYEERINADMTSWLEYFVSGFLSEMQLVIDKIKPFLYLSKKSQKPVILNQKEIKILDFLQEMNNITSKDVEQILTVSQRTAERYLAELIKKGLIKKQGTRKNAIYLII